MNIHKFSIYISTKDIYDKLMPNQKEEIENIIITSANLLGDVAHIECVALEKGTEITEVPYRQSFSNIDITAIEI